MEGKDDKEVLRTGRRVRGGCVKEKRGKKSDMKKGERNE